MPSRDESLRRILESHPAAAGLGAEQRQELLDHLCDAVEEKVRAGKGELEATAEALSEMGDLGRIARQYPREAVVATAEGWTARVAGWSTPAIGYVLLLAVVFLGVFIVPRVVVTAADANLELPAPVWLFLMATGRAGAWAGWFVLLPVAGALALRRWASPEKRRLAGILFAAAALVYLLGAVLAVSVTGALA
ncbi:MAG: hypothetical protein HYY18_10205 [Planctomycetes bacterium]|nr:hypothetical protein [Planctomycetota bacterium]